MIPASNAVAPTVPSLLYMAVEKSGKAPAKHVRMTALPVRASAARCRYATVRYVNVEVKM